MRSNDDSVTVRKFDAAWKARFEELGEIDNPEYQKASYVSEEFFSRRELFIRHLIKELLCSIATSPEKVSNCLDVGCGSGLYTKMIHDHHIAIQGVDYAKSLIEKATIAYPNIHFQKADAYSLPFLDGTFDSVISLGLLPCIGDWRKAITEMYRVLRPGGIAIIEMNRRFSKVEKIVRGVNWLVRKKKGFRDVMDFLHSDHISFSSSCEAKTHAVKEIVGVLRDFDIAEIIVHDPSKFLFFHEWFWAISFTKNFESKGSPRFPNIRGCPSCQRSGKWQLKPSRI